MTVTTSFQGRGEIVTSYEEIVGGGGGGGTLGRYHRGRGRGRLKETSLGAETGGATEFFDLKAETDRLMNRTEELKAKASSSQQEFVI